MTCALAIAIPNFALVCADTRLNLDFRNGSRDRMDVGDVIFTFEDGPEIRVGKSNRKIRRLRSGWVTGAGCFPLLHWCFQELKMQDAGNLSAVQQTLQSVLQRYGPIILQQLPGHKKEIELTTLLLVYEQNRVFSLYPLRFDGQDLQQDKAQFYLLSPPEFDDYTSAQVSMEFGQKFQAPYNMQGLIAGLRTIAETFHSIHQRSNTVSDMIEVGMMLRSSDGEVVEFQMLAKTTSIINVSDAQVFKLLKRI